MGVTFFQSPPAFRAWLAKHHRTATELWVGYHKKATGKRSLTWSESVDEALCFGWIDGVRNSVNAESYTIRFSPRKPGSAWSALNLRKMEALKKAGRMTSAGLEIFETRDHKRSGYAVRDFAATLDPAAKSAFRANRAAWVFFEQQPPGYRRIAVYWVMNAKRAETRARRLELLMKDSAAGRRLGALTSPARRKK